MIDDSLLPLVKPHLQLSFEEIIIAKAIEKINPVGKHRDRIFG
jgi:hypothetical protein